MDALEPAWEKANAIDGAFSLSQLTSHEKRSPALELGVHRAESTAHIQDCSNDQRCIIDKCSMPDFQVWSGTLS